MQIAEHEVQSALDGLKPQGLLRFVHPSHGRSVTRFRQVADEAWQLDPAASAVVAVLLLRGPQTAAELRTRCERLHDVASVDEVDNVLRALEAAGQAHLLERQYGQKEARWQQLLADEVEQSHVAAAVVVTPANDRIADLEARVARLEAALADLLPSAD